MRTNSDQVFDAGGRMNGGTLSSTGSHSHAARNTTSTVRLAAIALPDKGVWLPPLIRSLVSADTGYWTN